MAEKTADEYIREHWIPRKVWNNLNAPKHQERLKKCAELTRGNRLADVGCACGHSTEIMRGFRSAEWMGIDFSSIGIQRAKEFFPRGNWGYIPDLKGLHNLNRFKFDSIVCSEVLEHCKDDRLLVEGLWNAVEERLVFTTPSVPVNDPGHIRLYDEAMLENLFEGIPHTVENANRFFYIVCDKKMACEAPAPVEETVEADSYLVPPEDDEKMLEPLPWDVDEPIDEESDSEEEPDADDD